MHELTGKISGVSFSYPAGNPLITFELNEKQSALNMVDALKGAEKLSLKIDRFREKRSLDANRYLWQLCSMIADKLSDDGAPYTKEEIYRKAIKARGVCREQGGLPPDFAKTSRTAWEMLGTGWITEQVDFEPDGERVIVRYYYGSSTYNTKQMSRIIDWLVVECQQQGIETKSQEEIDSLLQSWGNVQSIQREVARAVRER